MNGIKGRGTKKMRFSRRAMVGLLASLMLVLTIIPSAVMADSSSGGGQSELNSPAIENAATDSAATTATSTATTPEAEQGSGVRAQEPEPAADPAAQSYEPESAKDSVDDPSEDTPAADPYAPAEESESTEPNTGDNQDDKSGSKLSPSGVLDGSVTYKVGDGAWVTDDESIISLPANDTSLIIQATFPSDTINKKIKVEFLDGIYPTAAWGFTGNAPSFAKDSLQYGAQILNGTWTRGTSNYYGSSALRTYGGAFEYSVDSGIINTPQLLFKINRSRLQFSDNTENISFRLSISFTPAASPSDPPVEGAEATLKTTYDWANGGIGAVNSSVKYDPNTATVSRYYNPSTGSASVDGRAFDEVHYQVAVPAGLNVTNVTRAANPYAGSTFNWNLSEDGRQLDIAFTNTVSASNWLGFTVSYALADGGATPATYTLTGDAAQCYAIPEGKTIAEKVSLDFKDVITITNPLAAKNIPEYISYQLNTTPVIPGETNVVNLGRLAFTKAANVPAKTKQIVEVTYNLDYFLPTEIGSHVNSFISHNALTDTTSGYVNGSEIAFDYTDLRASIGTVQSDGSYTFEEVFVGSGRSKIPVAGQEKHYFFSNDSSRTDARYHLQPNQFVASWSVNITKLSTPTNPVTNTAGIYIMTDATLVNYTPDLAGTSVVDAVITVRDGENADSLTQDSITGHSMHKFYGSGILDINMDNTVNPELSVKRINSNGSATTLSSGANVYANNTLEVTWKPNNYQSTNSMLIQGYFQGFHLYLSTMPKMDIDVSTIKVLDANGVPVPYIIKSTFSDSNGNLVYELFNEEYKGRAQNLSVSYRAHVRKHISAGTANVKSHLGWWPDAVYPNIPLSQVKINSGAGVTIFTGASATALNNGAYSQVLSPANNFNLQIQANTAKPLESQTSFSADGGTTWSGSGSPAIVHSDTAALKMKVTMENNWATDLLDAVLYVPVPKNVGVINPNKVAPSNNVNNFIEGQHQQISAFGWSAELSAPLTLEPSYIVKYSPVYIATRTADTGATWYEYSELAGAGLTLADIRTVRVERANLPFEAAEEFTLDLTLPGISALKAMAGNSDIVAGAGYYETYAGGSSAEITAFSGGILFATGAVDGSIYKDNNFNGLNDSEPFDTNIPEITVKVYTAGYAGIDAYELGSATVDPVTGEWAIGNLADATVDVVFTVTGTNTDNWAFTKTDGTMKGTLTITGVARNSGANDAGMLKSFNVTFNPGTGASWQNSGQATTIIVPDTSPQQVLTFAADTSVFYNNLFAPLGHHFVGWSEADGAAPATFDATLNTHTVTGHIDFYPVWEKNKSSILFYNETGSSLIGSISGVEFDKSLGDSSLSYPTYSRTGYTFISWNNSTASTSAKVLEATSAGTALMQPVPTMPAGTLVVYAKASLNDYTVKFHLNDGVATVADDSVTQSGKHLNDSVSLPTSFANEGHTLLGFSVNPSAVSPDSGLDVAPGVVASITLDADAIDTLFEGDTLTERTLYAVWDTNYYELSYVLNGSVQFPSNPVSIDSEFIPYGSLIADAVGYVSSPTRVPYSFVRWYTDAGFTAEFNESDTMPGHALTLYARWTPTDYSVTYEPGEHGTFESTTTYDLHYGDPTPAAPATTGDAGYSFTGWSPSVEATVGMGNVTYSALWAPNPHKIIFNKNNDKATGMMEDQSIDFGETVALSTNAFTLAGYTFAGWAKTATGTVYYGDGANYTLATDGDVTLYALWTANGGTGYKVEHYLIGASGDAVKTDTTNHTAKTDSAANATPKNYAHYTFNPAHPLTVSGGIVTAGGELTLRLYYQINSHSVTYKVTGKVPAGAPTAPAAKSNVAYGSNMTVAQSLRYAGYTFSGWKSSQVSGANFSMPDQNVVFTGSWTANEVPPPVVPPLVNPPTPPTVTPPTVTPVVTPPVVEPPALDEPIADPPEPEVDQPVTEPARGPEPTDSVTKVTAPVYENFSDEDRVKLDEQTGNLFSNLLNNKVPFGNFAAKGAWSILSLLFSVVAVIISILLAVSAVIRRKDESEDRELYTGDDRAEKRKNAVIFRALAIVAGILTPIVWLILDDLGQPMTWINKWTLYVGIIFIAHIVLFAVYKHRNNRKVREEGADYAEGTTTL